MKSDFSKVGFTPLEISKTPDKKTKSLTGFTPLEISRTPDKKTKSLTGFTPLEISRTPDKKTKSLTAFTLLELLIVISIIAILAAAIIPNFVGFDAEARLAATKSNLTTLRTRVSLFRTKEGRYPERLEELLEVTYNDMGVERPYLDLIPVESVSSKRGSADVENMASDDFIAGDGGWIYFTDKAKVVIDYDAPLDSSWGEAEGEVPIEW